MVRYRSVFVLILAYGSSTWLPEIRPYSTKMMKLERLQNSILRILTGAYQCTSTAKLMEILNVIPIEQELQIMSEVRQLPPNLRRTMKSDMKRYLLNERTTFLSLKNCQFGSLRTREAIWCLTRAVQSVPA